MRINNQDWVIFPAFFPRHLIFRFLTMYQDEMSPGEINKEKEK